MQALARPDPGEGDVDVAAGLETGEPDQPLGEFNDLDRLAHVENVDRHVRLRLFESVTCRRDHQVAGLADGHEVPHHLRMRHRQRAPRFDLRLEFRDDGPVRGEHIAEAYGDQAHGALMSGAAARELIVERLAIHFGKALRGAEHGYRLDRLVGRDHHHGGGAGGGGGIGDVNGAENVGLDPLAPVRFEQRHVLERRGMEHEVRPKVAHQAQDARTVAHVGEPAFDPRTRRLGCQHFKDRMQRRLGILDHQEPRRTEGNDAVADFRADRATAAGDDD